MRPTLEQSGRRRATRVFSVTLALSLLFPAFASAKKDDDGRPPRGGPARNIGEPAPGTNSGGSAPGNGRPPAQTGSGKPTEGGIPGSSGDRQTPDAGAASDPGKGSDSGDADRSTTAEPSRTGGTKQPGNARGEGSSTDRRSGKETGTTDDATSSVGAGNGTPRVYIVTFVPSTKPDEAGRALVSTFNENVRRNELRDGKPSRSDRGGRPTQDSNRGRGTYLRAFEKVLNAAVIAVPPSAVPGLLRNPRVLSIEEDVDVLLDPVGVTEAAATWGIDRIDQRTLPLSGTFSSPSTAAGVTAYVVDTGIDASHPEFAGRVAPGFDAIGTGTGDCNGHGTHVAGTIGGKTYGVAKDARLVPVRVLDCAGSGSYSGVIAGLDWIAKNRPVGERAVVNMSLGGGVSSSLDAAVASLIASGVSVVVAAGNSNVDACTTSPARAAAAITVGASTSTDVRASYSNFGGCLDLFAPGSGITSAVPGGTATYSGTSMAAPHVAGIAAVILSLENLSPADLASRITSAATSGVLGSAGTNSPNLLAFLPQDGGGSTPSASAPLQPAAPVAEARSKAAVVSWALPSDGGAAITAQTIRTYVGSRLVATLRADGTTTSVRVTRLKPGTEYTFTVQATNRVGPSPESSRSNPVRPLR